MAISETKGQGWRAIPSHPKGKGTKRLILIITLAPTTAVDNYRTARLS